MEGAATVDVAPSAEVTSSDATSSFVVANVLGVMAGRLGFDFGTIVAPHLAPVGSLHVQAMFLPSREQMRALNGAGGEVGLRYYGERDRPTGGFIGVYAVGGRYHASSEVLELGAEGVPLASYGAAADVGWSWKATSSIIATVGGGIEYRFAQTERDEHPGELADLMVSEGWKPRLLFQLGRLF